MPTSEKIFIYRPFVKKIYWSVVCLLAFTELIILRLNIYEIIKQDTVGAVVKIFVLSTVVISIFFRLWIFIRPRVFSVYKLKGVGIEISLKKKLKVVEFSQIKKVQFSKLPPRFAGGYWVELKTGQRFFFSTLLEGSDQILNEIEQHRADLFDLKKLSQYNKQVRWLSLSWNRLHYRFKVWPLFFGKLFVWPLLLGFIFFSQNKEYALRYSVLVIFIFCLMLNFALHILENIWFVHIAETKQLKAIDHTIENYFLIGFSTVYFVVTALLLYLFI